MLVLFHDFTSPASALAVNRLQRVVDEGGRARFVGVDLLGLDRTIPPTLSLLAELAQRREALEALGWEVRRPTLQPPTLSAHLVTGLAEARDLGASWRGVCYRSYFEEGVDLAEPAALAELARRAGLDPAEVTAALADGARRRALRRAMAGHRGDGVGGVPVLAFDGTYLSPFVPMEELRTLASL